MKQSTLFTRTQKNAPKDEVSLNAQLLIRAGFIDKEMAGVYSFLPLGLRTLNKIIDIIRQEMNAIGGQELYLTALQNPELWKKTGRWSDDVLDVWFKTEVASGGEVGLGTTHEEPLTNLIKKHISSYKDLPRYVYQFQTKFRNEKRAKSGIMRLREFIMKDLYSFHTDQNDLDEYYEKAARAYANIFRRAGLGDLTYRTYASGGTFAKYSHEFQTLTEAGEDLIYICDKCHIAVNKEIIEDLEHKCPECGASNLREGKAVEVGNIFKLGTKFSAALELNYKDQNGETKPVIMGCYGIGPQRLMGTIAEILSDERGLVWPEAVAPFQVHLLSLGKNAEAEKIYDDLVKNNIEILFDDREDASAGAKFADADLIGIPWRIVLSEKSLAAGGAEIKRRNEKDSHIVPLADIERGLK
ncbi:MAG: His/Gly/Thr/Pro-type tRNA ligase C-terminal domain-containing protein [Candidatus Pacebacteria bacterium]|nr:His/Gly/Thr/Pro-type tRNA ligase C-terminal domain-containing protein [Candidatus Paceibacterota bacterium]MDR3583134.1 His/Gly/Thr/Pro-type tRNA ligase C-terminal domain-containing protein [Candidatus Paceibacterota bacterium]